MPSTYTKHPLTLDELETLQDLLGKIFLSRPSSDEDRQLVACARLNAWAREQHKQMQEVQS